MHNKLSFMHIEDDFMTVVPPPFEAGTCLLSLSDTEQSLYPILLTVELRASLLRFKTPLASPFHKLFLIGLTPLPDSLKRNK
jgi:hypothetical protein